MCASTLKTFINVKYAEKVDKDKTGGVDADPVLEPLLKILGEGQVVESKEEMAAHLRSDKVTKFKPIGTKIDEFKSNDDTSFELYFVDCATDPNFRDYHSKLQPWIMFYIDAASYIGMSNF